jgi:hypothetical protein
MIFTKKEQSAVQEELIKKTVSDEQGKPLVHINISYPSFKLKEKNKLKQAAQPFYQKSATNFLRFAEKDLVERAKKLSEANEPFRPLGAVMKYVKAFESKHILSGYTDISVYNGQTEQNCLRSAQVWNKDKGYIYSFKDFFDNGAKDYLLMRFGNEGATGGLDPEEYKKRLKQYFNESNFYITEKEAVFFYPAERLGGHQGIRVFYTPTEELKRKKLLKISL